MRIILTICILLLLGSSCKHSDKSSYLTTEEQEILNNPEAFLDSSTNPPQDGCSINCTDEHLGQAVGVLVGVVKSGLDKSVVQGAEVGLGGKSFVTFAAGTFAFAPLVIGQIALVSYSHPNFVPSSSEVLIKYGTTNFVEKFLAPVGMKKQIKDGENIYLVDGPAVVRIYELMRSNGEMFRGDIDATMTYLSLVSEESVDAFPGFFEGRTNTGEILPFIANGLVTFSLRSSTDGSKVEPSRPAELTFPLNENIEGDPPTLEVWKFNNLTGEWNEKGVAYRQDNGSYATEVEESGTFCIAQPIFDDLAKNHNAIVMETHDGPRAKEDYVRLYARGKGWRGHSAYTNQDGEFEIPVFPNKEYKIKATATFRQYEQDGKVYRGEYTAQTNYFLRALYPGEVSEDEK